MILGVVIGSVVGVVVTRLWMAWQDRRAMPYVYKSNGTTMRASEPWIVEQMRSKDAQ